jgi:hypothetical protein
MPLAASIAAILLLAYFRMVSKSYSHQLPISYSSTAMFFLHGG